MSDGEVRRMGEHECNQMERLGRIAQWMETSGAALVEMRDEQHKQGLLLAEVGIKIKNVEREVFSRGEASDERRESDARQARAVRGRAILQIVLPPAAVVGLIEGLRYFFG